MRKRIRTNHYHPVVNEAGQYVGGTRDVYTRLKEIKDRVDLKDKILVDLGCQTGFFSISLAPYVKRVIAIDSDPEALKVASGDANKFGITNIEFINASVTSEILEKLPDDSVILFMSVLHHIVIDSKSYRNNGSMSQSGYDELLKILRKKASTLVFEMGEVTEKIHWARDLKKVVKKQKPWIYQNVFQHSYSNIDEIPGSNFNYWPFSKYPWMHIPFARWPYGRKALRKLGMEWNDFRTLYIAYR